MKRINRKEQIEGHFIPALLGSLKEAGCPVNEQGVEFIKLRMRHAAMVGACEERSRTLEILRQTGHNYLADSITEESVLIVIGYNE